MEATFVRVDELRLGKIIAEDIFANTQYPIVYKDTKISYEHLHVFNAFGIQSVLVYEEQLEKEESKQIKDENVSQTKQVIEQVYPQFNSFEKLYLDAVTLYKKEFLNWQAGAKIEITKIRQMMMPLVDKVLDDRKYLFELNNFSNPKDYLYHHCIATGLITAMVTQKLGYDKGTILQMAIAGALADSGMSKVPTKIREKQQSLNEQEFSEIRKHPYYSYLLVRDLTALKDSMKIAIYQHHERLDGSGYPTAQKIDKIIKFAQIIAIADVFHAMTSERLYRTKQSPFKVVEMIKEEEFGKFDIGVVQALMDLIVVLPIGTKVELSNLERGEVMFFNNFAPTRPMVKITSTNEIIDLATNRSFYISRVITNE